MWYHVFLGAVVIVSIIRVVLIMTGQMDAKSKTEKAGNWIVGLVVFSIAWFVLSQVFKVDIGGLGKPTKNTANTETGGYFKKMDEDNNRFFSKDTVQIKISTLPE